MPSPTVFWFRRDLRLADNPALTAAVQASGDAGTVGVFVVDPTLWGRSGPNRKAFLVDSLVALGAQCGGRIVIRTGEPARELLSLAVSVGADAVYATSDFGPYGRRRDDAVAAALAESGRELRLIDSPYAVRPGTLLTGGGTPYKVFTPFFRAWKSHGWPEPTPAPAVDWQSCGASMELPERPFTDVSLPPAGEHHAWDRVDAFLGDRVARYGSDRDHPGVPGTSQLSPYLKWGTIHPRQLLARLGPSQAEDVFRSELCWREFYADVLADRPDTARNAYRPGMAAMEVDSGPDADAFFTAWCEGQTGYPIVDAGMRQLAATGWMHNRVRMIVASFLVKDLHIDWTRGARHFMAHLVDGDLASNSHGWQWVAGTGTDASPYFRIFNPVTQSRKFDPDGAYLRAWVPEIAHLPNRSIHEPWTEKTGPPAGYPAPLVDHSVERTISLDRYQRLKQTWA